MNGVDTMQTVGEIKTMIEATRARSVRIDDTAIGNGVSDRLRELKREALRSTALWRCEIVPINFGSRAFNEERFADIRTEMWWACGEALRKGSLLLPGAVELPDDLELQRELSRPAMLKTSNGRLRLESKDSMRARGIESPDAADAACLALYPRGWIRSGGVRIRLIET
jgi:hypothetical protein